MKRILFVFFLIACVEKVDALTLQITKVTANIDAFYGIGRKDTLLRNNAQLTTNLLPIHYFTFYFKWQDLVSLNYDEVLQFDIYNNWGERISSQTHFVNGFNQNDSMSMSADLGYTNWTAGQNFNYEVRISFLKGLTDQILLATSNKWSLSVIADPNKIYNNTICCSQIVRFPYTATDAIKQKENTFIYTAGASQIEYTWQQLNTASNWIIIAGATSSSYLPSKIVRGASYRRVAVANRGLSTESYNISNIVSFSQYVCPQPNSDDNIICTDQDYFELKHGDVIYPPMILGSSAKTFNSRDRGYEYWMSEDNINWKLVQKKYRVQVVDPSLHYKIDPITFDISKGSVQRFYYRRDLYQWYDPWNCGLGKLKWPCGGDWFFVNSSNIVIITLTSFGLPKPVPDSITNESGSDMASCSYSDQTRTFSVPRVNNGETYKWEIPAGWITYTALEGPYVNSITVSTNSAGATFAQGGNVCLTIKQPGQVNSMCRYIQGSEPFSVNLPAKLTGCEGSSIVVKPVVLKNNTVQPNAQYSFGWETYQSPNTECNIESTKYSSGCPELKINISNVHQNPVQPIKVIATNKNSCSATFTTNLTTAAGLQMGILKSFNDPKAASTSNLALDQANDDLYFTSVNNVIQQAYFDNSIGKETWLYKELKDKNKNIPIKCDGSIAFFKGTTSNKLFYVYLGNLYYAESLDNGFSWTDYYPTPFVNSIGTRIKMDGTNLYYIDAASNKIFSKSLLNSNPGTLVGNTPINYSQDMFTVEEGILSYADQNNNILAFDALTGVQFAINIPANEKSVAYNSAISIYNKNIYFVSPAGKLRILQRSSTSSSYTAYQDVAGQLSGPFAINRETGTVYAKATDVPGKQIYYLNSQWNTIAIKNYLQGSPIRSSMVYGNGHAYYIGTNGLLSNTFYVTPCIPQVLRTGAATPDVQSGDLLNDPLPLSPEAIGTLAVYPNPATDLAHIVFAVEESSSIQIKIISLYGREDVPVRRNVEPGTHNIELPLGGYAAGAYIIQLYVEGELTAAAKLIKY